MCSSRPRFHSTRCTPRTSTPSWNSSRKRTDGYGANGARHPPLADPTTLNLFVQDTLVRGAPWALSAALLLLDARLPDDLDLPDPLRALPALVKFGVDSPPAAYASTLAAEDRDTARKLADLAAASGVEGGFSAFLRWLSELLVEDLRLALGDGPETMRLTRRIARLSSSDLALQLLMGGRSGVAVAVHGLTFDNRAVALIDLGRGDPVRLGREPDNAHDPNAIRVRHSDGRDLGYLARDAARGIAGRLDDSPESVDAAVLEADAAVPLLRLQLTLH